MSEHPLDGQQKEIFCNCGRRFIVEFWSTPGMPRHRTAMLLDRITGGTPDNCPSCGVSLAITKEAWQHIADKESEKLR